MVYPGGGDRPGWRRRGHGYCAVRVGIGRMVDGIAGSTELMALPALLWGHLQQFQGYSFCFSLCTGTVGSTLAGALLGEHSEFTTCERTGGRTGRTCCLRARQRSGVVRNVDPVAVGLVGPLRAQLVARTYRTGAPQAADASGSDHRGDLPGDDDRLLAVYCAQPAAQFV